jgi:hypothetical protein
MCLGVPRPDPHRGLDEGHPGEVAQRWASSGTRSERPGLIPDAPSHRDSGASTCAYSMQDTSPSVTGEELSRARLRRISPIDPRGSS